MMKNPFSNSSKHPDKYFSGLRLVLIGIGIMFCINVYAQFLINGIQPMFDERTHSFLVSIPQNCWGEDYDATISLTKESTWQDASIDGQPIQQTITFTNIHQDSIYTLHAFSNGEYIDYTLAFTYLPILHLTGDFGKEYSSGVVNLQEPGCATQTMNANIKWRGGTSNTDSKHKKNYKIQFVDDLGASKDYSFFSLRNDDDWILDAGQVDMFRLRNLIASKLWNDFATKPYYATATSDVYTASRGEVVELFLNDEYLGIYNFCEPIDRKQLKLKKYNEKTSQIHGGLWKAAGWGYATFWDIPEIMYDNTKPTWNVFELKYPKIEDVCTSDYSTLYNAIYFVSDSNNIHFADEIDQYIDIPVYIDYYLFVNLINAFDLSGKNLYWAVYDKQQSKKLTLALWDMDCTVGQNYTNDPLRPDYVAYDYEILNTTTIGIRLIESDADGYWNKLRTRYFELRENFFSIDYLTNTYRYYYELMKLSGAASREERRWNGDSDLSYLNLNFEEEYAYIIDWLEHRLQFLDLFFSNDVFPAGIHAATIDAVPNRRYSLSGIQVNPSYKGIVIIKGKKYFVK